jgi:hypothetical protein
VTSQTAFIKIDELKRSLAAGVFNKTNIALTRGSEPFEIQRGSTGSNKAMSTRRVPTFSTRKPTKMTLSNSNSISIHRTNAGETT